MNARLALAAVALVALAGCKTEEAASLASAQAPAGGNPGQLGAGDVLGVELAAVYVASVRNDNEAIVGAPEADRPE